jgi:hypothetical protein
MKLATKKMHESKTNITDSKASAEPSITDYTGPLVSCLEWISKDQSDLNRYGAAVRARDEKKNGLLAEVEKQVADAQGAIRADCNGSTTGQLTELIGLKLAKERYHEVFDELFPPPVLDSALEDRLGRACYEFTNHYLDKMRRAYRAQHLQALKRLEQTLGNDPSQDAEGLDREAIAASSPDCRRIEAMIEARAGFSRLSFRLDLETDYHALYQALLDEVGRELELLEGELPPSVPEPDRQLKPVIVSRPQEPDDLPPPGWTVRRTVNS